MTPSPPPSERLSPPDFIAERYRLEEKLGAGAYGVVWKAYDDLLGRSVALKELRPPAGRGVPQGSALDRFLGEARAAAQLNHPTIVTIHDVIREESRVLISMELLEAPTLGDVLRRAGAVPAKPARSVLVQVAEALATAHAAGIVHRDIKPDNIFWLPSGRVVVSDFGLARVGQGSDTTVGTLMGTPGYMAPEQVQGEVARATADVFAWGAVAYELLTGRPPFGDPVETDTTAVLYRIVHEDPAEVRLDEDPTLAAVIMLAINKDETRRPGGGGDLVEALGDSSARSFPPPTDALTQEGGSGAVTLHRAPKSPDPELSRDAPVSTVTNRRSRLRRPTKAVLAEMILGLTLVGALIVLGFLYLDGGMGYEVRTQKLGSLEDVPVPSEPPNPNAGRPGTVFYRVNGGNQCSNVLRQVRAGATSIYCAKPGSLLPGDGEIQESEGQKWVRVKEPITNAWGWVPMSSVVSA